MYGNHVKKKTVIVCLCNTDTIQNMQNRLRLE